MKVCKSDATWRFFGDKFATVAWNPGKVMINLIPVRSPFYSVNRFSVAFKFAPKTSIFISLFIFTHRNILRIAVQKVQNAEDLQKSQKCQKK